MQIGVLDNCMMMMMMMMMMVIDTPVLDNADNADNNHDFSKIITR